MENSRRNNSKTRRKIKLYAARTALIATYTITSMYIGDRLDMHKDYIQPAWDDVTNVETAEGFASHDAVDLVTIINEHGQRETYLSYDKIDGGRQQLTMINDDGYAVPENYLERLENFFLEKKEELENLGTYEKMEEFLDKVDVLGNYYKIKAKEFINDLLEK